MGFCPFQGVDLFTEVMIVSDPDKHLAGQENRVNKIDIEGQFCLVTCYCIDYIDTQGWFYSDYRLFY